MRAFACIACRCVGLFGEAQGIHQRGQSGGAVAAAGVVEEVAGEGRTPIPEHLDEAALGDERSESLFDGGANADALEDRADDEVRVVEGDGTLRVDGEGLAAFFKFPSIDSIFKAKANAGMVFQILRSAGDFARLKVGGRADDGETHVAGNAHGNHVALDELSDLDAGVVLAGDEVDGAVRGCDFENDLGVVGSELREPRHQDHAGGGAGDDEAQATGGVLAAATGFGEGVLDAFESRSEIREQGCPGGGGSDAASGASEQLEADAALEGAQSVAERGLRDAKAGSGAGEAAFFRNDGEGGKVSEVVSPHS